MFLKNFCKSIGISRIYGVPYNSQYQGAEDAFNKLLKISLPQQKTKPQNPVKRVSD